MNPFHLQQNNTFNNIIIKCDLLDKDDHLTFKFVGDSTVVINSDKLWNQFKVQDKLNDYCFFAIGKTTLKDFWVLGEAFIRDFYIEIDYDNSKINMHGDFRKKFVTYNQNDDSS